MEPYTTLMKRLLEHGGRCLVVPPTDVLDVDRLLRDGTFVTPDRVCLVPGAPCDCHRNVRNLLLSGMIQEAWCGYALPPSGEWTEHSWGIADGCIVETTDVGWTTYFGALIAWRRGADLYAPMQAAPV